MAVTQNFTLDKNDGSGVKVTRPWTMNVSVFPGEEVFAGTGANPGTLLRWAVNSDGSGTTYEIGAVVPLARKVYYAVWLKPTPYLVTDWDLEAVADAIRAKGGTSEQLAFPTGFVGAIGGISTGPATRPVTIQDSPYDNLYYTDANMNPVEVHGPNTDITDVPLPVGSILVLARTGVPGPMPSPMTVSGLELLDTYTVDTNGEARIYQVMERNPLNPNPKAVMFDAEHPPV